jgi:multiple sugar transport system ATP-binding protein
MNLLKGVVRREDRPVVEIGDMLLPIPAQTAAKDGRPVVYGIRPEHIELSAEGAPLRISVVEPTGSETLVFTRFGDSEILALFRERHDFRPGDTPYLRPRLDQVHLFDAETGKRLQYRRQALSGGSECSRGSIRCSMPTFCRHCGR